MATVLHRDITHTLQLLRDARTLGDQHMTSLYQRRLDRLLDKLPRPKT